MVWTWAFWLITPVNTVLAFWLGWRMRDWSRDRGDY